MGSIDTYDMVRGAGALCAALLLYLSVTYGLEGVYEGDHLEKPAYAVEALEAEGDAGGEEEPAESIPELLAMADTDRGKKVFKRCAACHQAENATKHGVGPALWGVLGRDIAASEDFAYSRVLGELDGAWTWENMNAFLTKPKEWAKGTKMNFAGLKKPADRASILVWLNGQSDSPLPLPSAPAEGQ